MAIILHVNLINLIFTYQKKMHVNQINKLDLFAKYNLHVSSRWKRKLWPIYRAKNQEKFVWVT